MQLLFEHDHNPDPKRSEIEKFVQGRLREPALRTFCLQLYDGTVQHQGEIDPRLGEAAENWRVARMATVDRNVLRLGAFELLHCPDTPPAVVIDEAIELARRFGTAESPAFVNGVLDRLRPGAAPAQVEPTAAPPAEPPAT
jgi:N utilization substance protein B